jgi:glyoxylase-like metal-dependent hydrolase (beta-lactamase superfamily II)
LRLNCSIKRYSGNLSLIILPPVAPGFENFIGVWLYKGEISFIVDVGTSSTAGALSAAIAEAGVKNLDYIFLTHIHVDHAGAIGEISDLFPAAPVICHKEGIPHLADPEKLWKGTKKALGETADAYGPVKPVPAERLYDPFSLDISPVTAVPTPGHSIHHMSYIYNDLLFAGEAGGVYYLLPSGRGYMRPATPPKFFRDEAHQSVETLIAKNPAKICYGHLGFKENACVMLKEHKKQLDLWEEVIKNEMAKTPDDTLVSRCINMLLMKDAFLTGYFNMEKGCQERERFFLSNSIKGFADYIGSMPRADNP